MKYYFFLILFMLMGTLSIKGQIDRDQELYRKIAIQYYKEFISQFPEHQYQYHDCKEKKVLSVVDTMNFVYHLPFFPLLNPELPETTPVDYTKLLDLIDFSIDPLTQWIILTEDFCNDIIYINKGIAERLEVYMKKQMDEGDIRDPTILSTHDSRKLLIGKFKFFTDNEKFNSNLFQEYVNSNSNIQFFTIHFLGGLWGIQDGELLHFRFHNDSIEIKEREIVYQELIREYGEDTIKNVICGSIIQVQVEILNGLVGVSAGSFDQDLNIPKGAGSLPERTICFFIGEKENEGYEYLPDEQKIIKIKM